MEIDHNLELFIGTKETTVRDAHVGLLLLESGSIIMKTEYGEHDSPECYIVSSGETYCGGMEQKCVSLQIL